MKDMFIKEHPGKTLKEIMISFTHVKQTLWLALSIKLYTTSCYDIGIQEGVIIKKRYLNQ